ncbi:MAG: threonine/serine exporter family protein [Candidatus Cloacimonetes bacterium]|nr:threonine/serine exporter family protein [Candidatus Cloacimonadota bacterium]
MNMLSVKQVTEIALNVGRILLQSGATTNRVELLMRKVCTGFGYPDTESFVTPTGIFISVKDSDAETSTSIKRIDSRKIDLGKITRISRLVNCLSEKKCHSSLRVSDLKEFKRELDIIDAEVVWKSWLTNLCGGATSGFFCLLFGGTWIEFIVATVIGVIVSFGMKYLVKLSFNNFLQNAFAAAFIVLLAKVFDLYVPYINLDNIIIGGIMLLVPGLSITNAIRDTMSGDLVSGSARALEAMFITVGIVAGSGSMLKIWELWGY